MRKLLLTNMLRWSFAFALLINFQSLNAQNKTPQKPGLTEQLQKAKARSGTAFEALIKANQDFSLLRDDEYTDDRLLPLWLRVYWRKAHPEGVYTADDPSGGYPLVLKEILEWMETHQDLKAGNGVEPGTTGTQGTGSGAPITNSVLAGEQRISGLQTNPRSESDIRINFFDPAKIISASNNIGGSGRQSVFYTTNSGATWSQSEIPLETGDVLHSDPTVDWTSDGKAWSSAIGIGGGNLRMRNYYSTDNGATWTFDATFSGTQTNTDKQMVWIDHNPASPYFNRTYAIWHNGPPAYMNRRTAGAAGTWLANPIQVSGLESAGTAIGADVKTNSFGDVFGFWPSIGNRRIFVTKSTDGGDTYTAPVQIATTYDAFTIGVPSFAQRLAFIYVSGGAYRTATKNLVYAAWMDLSGEGGCTTAANAPGTNEASTCKTRIWFSRSTDGGATWSAAVKINADAGLNDQFNQWLAVDETTGAIGIMYYSTAGGSDRKKTDVYYQHSFNDGLTWSAAEKITTAQTDETVAGADNGGFGNQYGDYNGLSAYAGILFPSWTDRRNNAKEEIWTAKIDDPYQSNLCPNPENLSATANNTTATISWSAVSGAISYDVDYFSASAWVNAATATTATSVNLSSLVPNTSYLWRVRANCTAGTGNYIESLFSTPSLVIVTINQAAGQADPATTSPINFTVTFSEAVNGFDGSDITLSGTAGATNAIVTGTGPIYNVAVTGMAGSGTVIASIGANVANSAISGVGNTASTSTDNSVTTIPVIIATTPVTISAENALPLNNTPDPGETLTVNLPLLNTGTSSTVNLVATLQPTGGVTNPNGPKTYGVITNGGSSVSQPFTFTAAGNCGDVITLTLALQDGALNLGTVTYTMRLGVATSGGPQTFSNTTAIVIPATGTGASTGAPANPYPANIVVSGVPGTVSTINVSLKQFNHTFPSDVDVLLVSPSGEKMVIMSDVGGGPDAVDLNLELSDAAASSLPVTNVALVSGTFKPTNVNTTDAFPSPAPASPYLSPAPAGAATFTSAFGGINPNGTWSLYVVDDAGVDIGNFNGGWEITFVAPVVYTCSTVPPPPTVTINQAASQVDPTSTSPINFTVTFSEAVTGFATGDVTLSGTAGATTATVTGPGPIYNVAVTGMTGSGTVIASIAANVANSTSSTLGNTASTSTDNMVTYNQETGCGPVTTRIYVDASAAPGGTGSSWSCALQQLSTAITMANANMAIKSIWVADGTYKPGAARTDVMAITRADLMILGGFAGGEANAMDANPAVNQSIISGDIGVANDMSDNSYRLMNIGGSPVSASPLVVDGFVFENGNANGSGDRAVGAAILSNGIPVATPVWIKRSLFRNNNAVSSGGAVYLTGANLAFDGCRFVTNTAGSAGGAVFSFQASPSFVNSVFVGNTATNGGGYYGNYGYPTFNKTAFSGNSATYGGGVYQNRMGADYFNCVFNANTSFQGGAIYEQSASTSHILNSTFFKNTGVSYGGTIVLTGSNSSTVTENSIFWKNTHGGSATSPWADFVNYTGGANVYANNILQMNTAVPADNGTTRRFNKRGVDPLFTNELSPVGADVMWGTADDGLQLRDCNNTSACAGPGINAVSVGCSPAINAGDNTPVGVAGLTTDERNNPRIVCSFVDMGAYENQNCPCAPAPEASISMAKTISTSGVTGIVANPFANELQIRYTGAEKAGVTVYAASGKTMWSKTNITEGITRVNSSSWARGMYQVVIVTANGKRMNFKVVRL